MKWSEVEWIGLDWIGMSRILLPLLCLDVLVSTDLRVHACHVLFATLFGGGGGRDVLDHPLSQREGGCNQCSRTDRSRGG